MRHGQDGFRITAVAFAALALLPQPSWSSEESQPPAPARQVDVADVAIPSDLGYVLSTLPAFASSSPAPVIVHIQEAHTNYDAQRRIISILERLIQQHGLKLILVEGGHGDVGLAHFRRFGPVENRQAVADKYLKLGIVSAEEYLDIASDHPLTLWGVEEDALYDRHVQAFLAAETLQQSLRPVLASAREAAQVLKRRVFSPALLELDTASEAFAGNQLDLAGYADLLERLGNLQQVGFERTPELARFLDVRRLERGIQSAQVQQEQRALVQRLGGVVSQNQLEHLIAVAKRMKEGRAQAAEFYAELERLAADAQIPLESYPQLAHYVRYLRQSRELQPSVLSEELGRFAGLLRDSLTSTPESRQLSALVEEVGLVEKLLQLQLSPAEYERFRALKPSELGSRWTSALSAASVSLDRLKALESALPVLDGFYEAAGARDQALIENTVAKLQETQEPIAVLITGGFHGPQLTQQLQARGVGVVVVVPKMTQATDERLYHAVLKYKSGHGSFADVEAAARQSDVPAAPTGPPGLAGGIKQ